MISTLNSWAIGGNDHDDEGDDHEQKPERHDGDRHSTGNRPGHEEFDDRVQSDGDEQRHSHDDQDAGDVRQATKEQVGNADAQCPRQTDEEWDFSGREAVRAFRETRRSRLNSRSTAGGRMRTSGSCMSGSVEATRPPERSSGMPPPSRPAVSVVLMRIRSLEASETGIEERKEAKGEETEGNGTYGHRPERVVDQGS